MASVAQPVLKSNVTTLSINPLRACQEIGWCHSALNRMCWTDLWSRWEAVHAAFGMPMQWRGPLTMQPVELVRVWGFLLRSIDGPQFVSALAECDRHMRRARMNVFRDMEQSHETTVKMIDLHRDDQTTQGREDQASRVANLYVLRNAIEQERPVLFGVTRDHYIELNGQRVRVSIDHAEDTGTDLIVAAQCPTCGDDTDWTAEPARPFDSVNQIRCQSCDNRWVLGYGEVR